jgi:hypothetical protein
MNSNAPAHKIQAAINAAIQPWNPPLEAALVGPEVAAVSRGSVAKPGVAVAVVVADPGKAMDEVTVDVGKVPADAELLLPGSAIGVGRFAVETTGELGRAAPPFPPFPPFPPTPTGPPAPAVPLAITVADKRGAAKRTKSSLTLPADTITTDRGSFFDPKLSGTDQFHAPLIF